MPKRKKDDSDETEDEDEGEYIPRKTKRGKPDDEKDDEYRVEALVARRYVKVPSDPFAPGAGAAPRSARRTRADPDAVPVFARRRANRSILSSGRASSRTRTRGSPRYRPAYRVLGKKCVLPRQILSPGRKTSRALPKRCSRSSTPRRKRAPTHSDPLDSHPMPLVPPASLIGAAPFGNRDHLPRSAAGLHVDLGGNPFTQDKVPYAAPSPP